MSASESDDANWPNGLCAACHQRPTVEGHDPCIPSLPGVLFACCGHGNESGYIKFEDGRCLRFTPIVVDLDLPSVKTEDGIPYFNLGGNRVFRFDTKKVVLERYGTNIIRTSKRGK